MSDDDDVTDREARRGFWMFGFGCAAGCLAGLPLVAGLTVLVVWLLGWKPS